MNLDEEETMCKTCGETPCDWLTYKEKILLDFQITYNEYYAAHGA